MIEHEWSCFFLRSLYSRYTYNTAAAPYIPQGEIIYEILPPRKRKKETQTLLDPCVEEKKQRNAARVEIPVTQEETY